MSISEGGLRYLECADSGAACRAQKDRHLGSWWTVIKVRNLEFLSCLVKERFASCVLQGYELTRYKAPVRMCSRHTDAVLTGGAESMLRRMEACKQFGQIKALAN